MFVVLAGGEFLPAIHKKYEDDKLWAIPFPAEVGVFI